LNTTTLLDNEMDQDAKFDQITKILAQICNTKFAFISLVNRDHLLFTSTYGLETKEVPREFSFCSHTILGNDLFEVHDVKQDERFKNHALCINKPHIRFYAGVPLITSDKVKLGTLSVLDSEVKQLTPYQQETLKIFARHVVDVYELRIKDKTLNTQLQESFILKNGIEAHAIVARTDKSGKIIYVNDLFCQISKYSKDELVGKNHSLVNSGHHPKSFFKEMWNTILAKKTWKGEIKNRAKDGSYYWVDTTIIPITSVTGETEGFISFRYEITKRKLIELELKEANHKLDSIVTEMDDVVWSVSVPDNKTLLLTPSVEKLYDISYEEIVHDPTLCHKLIYEEDVHVIEKMCKELNELGHYHEEYRIITRSGNLKWVSNKGKIITDAQDQSIRVDRFITDITERKFAEQHLIESEANLKEAHSIAKLGRWELDLVFNHLYWSDSVFEIFEIDQKRFGATYEGFLNAIHPDDRQVVNDAYTRSLETKQSYMIVHRLLMPDGRIKWLKESCRTEYDETGKALRSVGVVQEITESKLAELELLRTKDLLDRTSRVAQIGGWELDIPTNVANWTDITCAIHEVKPGYIPNVTTAFNFYKEGYSRELIKSLVHHAIEDGAGFDTELQIITALGKLRWVHVIGEVEFSGNKTVRLYGTVQDITEKRNAEDEIKRVSTELNKFFDLPLSYLAIAFRDGTLKKVNSTWLNLGYPKEEILSRKFLDFVHPEDFENTFEELNKLQNGTINVRFENRCLKKDGRVVHLEWAASSEPQTGALYFSAMDVTERKNREEITFLISHVRSRFIEMSASKEKFFDYLLNKILDLTDSEYGFIGEILENKQGKYLKTFSITDISWSEESKAFYQSHAPAGLEFNNLETLFGEVIKTGDLLIANSAFNHPKASGIPKGHPPLNRFMGIPIIHNGRMIAMAGVANKKDEYKLEEYLFLKPFFELVGEMIHSIRLSSELEFQKKISLHNAKLASIGELAAGVGHEINNPLAIIQGQLEMLKDFCTTEKIDFEEINTRIAKSLKGAERITNIVRGLRSFARVDDTAFSVINLSDLLKETQDMLIDLFSREEIDMQFNIESNLWVNGNRGRLQQVFVNILNNAKDAVSSIETKKIVVTAKSKGNQIEIKVCDSGPGVSEDIRSKIFDPFFTTKEVNKGTGIGLALASSIIKEHEGMISLNDEHEIGACFVITLKPHSPLSSDQLVPIEKRAVVSSPPQGQHRKQVLIVDDEEDLREILQNLLIKNGINVVTAANGKDALDYISKHYQDIDLVISDMKMPKMNGPELARAVKRFGSYQGGFLFITGGVNVSFDEYSEIVDGFLRKPIESEKSMSIINKWMRKKSLDNT
jgi:PAS domain S-box-containing protein